MAQMTLCATGPRLNGKVLMDKTQLLSGVSSSQCAVVQKGSEALQ